MSAQQQPAAGTGTPGTGRREVFRSVPALVVWWVWLVFAVANLADLALQGRDHFSAEVSAFIVLVTGVMYACALRPRVVADNTGITLLNPLRDHHVPWGAVTSVDLGDTLQVHTRRPDGGDKTLYSWAVQSARRSRARAEMRARRSHAQLERQSPGYAKLPLEAKQARGRTQAELTVLALTRRLADRPALAQGEAGQAAAWRARWAWLPIAAMVLPAIAMAVVVLA